MNITIQLRGMIVFLLAAALVPSLSVAQPWVSEDQRLLRGEVIISFQGPPSAGITSVHEVRGEILLDAPLELVWSVLTDYGSYSRVLPDVADSEVLERKGATTRVRMRINNLWPYPDFKYVLLFREDKSSRSLSWRMLQGGLRSLDGSCSLRSFPSDQSKTKVVYVFSRDPGWFVPRFSADLENRSLVIDRLLAIRKETRERKKALEGDNSEADIKPKWRKALFWWEKGGGNQKHPAAPGKKQKDEEKDKNKQSPRKKD